METVEKIVYTHPFWNRLNPDYFHILEECASFARFGVGQPIFRADSDAEYFYLIDQGSVGLEMFVRGKGVITIQTAVAGHAGETCGFLCRNQRRLNASNVPVGNCDRRGRLGCRAA